MGDLPKLTNFVNKEIPYLEAQKNYKSNSYDLDNETKERIRQRWGATCARYGYTLTEVEPINSSAP